MARNAQALLEIASGILETNATQRSTGLKNLLYDAHIQAGQRSMLIALVNGAHKERDQLFACAEEEGFLAALPAHLVPATEQSKEFFNIQVVLYEALLGSRRVRGTSDLVGFCKTRKKSLQMTLAERRKRGATHEYKPAVKMPRYVRVNHLQLSMPDAAEYIKSFGYKQVFPPPLSDISTNNNNYSSMLVAHPMTFIVDPCIPSLLILPPSTSFHGDEQVERGGLVLQDRSSCLTALALNPPPDAHCLDTCSAPGNKTLHVASIMSGSGNTATTSTVAVTGTVAAFERSENRFHTLSKRIDQQGASHFVTPHLRDFMTVDTAVEFQNVSHILIDPSCSGSGLVATYTCETPGELEHEKVDESVASLAREQLALILHAMSLPDARVIAYSTCSIHRKENEDVVLGVLAAAESSWSLVKAVPQWPHRGLDLPEFADIKDKVCRANLEQDGTNGFFVARFEKSDAAGKKEKKFRKKEKKKKRKSKCCNDNDESSQKKKSMKKEKKGKLEDLSDDDDAAVKKEKKKKRKSNCDNDNDDESSLKKKSTKKEKKRKMERLNSDGDDDTAVKKGAKKGAKKGGGRRENETKEERKERKAAKKRRRAEER